MGDERELLARLDGREVVRFDGSKQVLRLAGAKIVTYEKTVRENLLSRITDPNLALIAVSTGGSLESRSLLPMTPDIHPSDSNAMFVFSLP